MWLVALQRVAAASAAVVWNYWLSPASCARETEGEPSDVLCTCISVIYNVFRRAEEGEVLWVTGKLMQCTYIMC